ncbi:MAG: HAMP domain-containing histidine kinase, partial [Lachnospiraceae bacterium]|nr:HAMP domain-containing histidine kinase [Lachnospiraceae bacterium]
EFSKLQDEIYKTVTNLYQTREDALTARNNFAENLSNIAHQLKTPITSISLSVQMAKEDLGDSHITEIERQIDRLLYLEEALLLLSRIDAGTLVLDKRPTDVFTILSLASDNLYELFAQKGVLIDVPEMGGININADLDWTMEAVMNLMKNCMEAAETDTTVHCAYEKNPLYVQIQIWDEGEGFEREDIPHLFQRFYRGRRSKGAGIGIGLALSKAIIEMQNGVIRAFNLPGGGACFEIRFYSH